MFKQTNPRPATVVEDISSIKLTPKTAEFLKTLRDPANIETAKQFVKWLVPQLPKGIEKDNSSFRSFLVRYSVPSIGNEQYFKSDTLDGLMKEIDQKPELAAIVAGLALGGWLTNKEADRAVDAFKQNGTLETEAVPLQEPAPETPAPVQATPQTAPESGPFWPVIGIEEPGMDFQNDIVDAPMSDNDLLPDFGALPPVDAGENLPDYDDLADGDVDDPYADLWPEYGIQEASGPEIKFTPDDIKTEADVQKFFDYLVNELEIVPFHPDDPFETTVEDGYLSNGQLSQLDDVMSKAKEVCGDKVYDLALAAQQSQV